ncbi:MAG: hypothetical protein H0W47_17595 [Polaromonas sp.]|uniref:hypothetical protein n=1 Tax=Polaromonas sp. TaxID=1869339 RepID=UPI001839CC20|nr:hypothetical protein [Polaromonas sp.]MBA3595582.1 hypothetical protein [Polaromonas sp.]
MLEVLKQLQVKPRAPGGQGKICNQEMAGDCGFLGSFTSLQHDGNLSYRLTGKQGGAPVFCATVNAPALSAKTLQSLDTFGLYWPDIRGIRLAPLGYFQ